MPPLPGADRLRPVTLRSERNPRAAAALPLQGGQGTTLLMKAYMERVLQSQETMAELRRGLWVQVRRWLREKLPWIIILILLYHLFKIKVKFFSSRFKDYKSKALSIANSIKVENSLDFKFLLFSQFMRLLFSTIAP